MKKAIDTFTNKEVFAEEVTEVQTFPLEEKRYICPYCKAYVGLRRKSIRVKLNGEMFIRCFFHGKEGEKNCKYRTFENDNSSKSPNTSFGLPIYLTKEDDFSLKIGFLSKKN